MVRVPAEQELSSGCAPSPPRDGGESGEAPGGGDEGPDHAPVVGRVILELGSEREHAEGVGVGPGAHGERDSDFARRVWHDD